jgi:menaquinone-dependent protoporphyrinogen oxidase
MRVLVTWGSKRGGTEGIGRMLGEALAEHGFDVVATAAKKMKRLASAEPVDAAIVGGALYANRWPASARRLVGRNVDALRKVPVWFFSSGPLDDSADRSEIPPPPEVAVLAERVGARGHVTFGGRLEPKAKGFAASAMAKKHSGDWRNPDRIRAWAAVLAKELPGAVPARAVDHPARSFPRLLGYGVAGWALCAAVMAALLHGTSTTVAFLIHAIAAPAIFTALAWRYFRARGARDPLPAALIWTASVAALDVVVVAGAILHSPAMLTSVAGFWLPLALIFASTWATGSVLAMLPERPPLASRGDGSLPRGPAPRTSGSQRATG